MEHQTGQLRAQLFDIFVDRLLRGMYAGVTIERNVALANPERNQPYGAISVDFLVLASERGEPDLLVETKAPYTGATTIAIKNALRQLVNIVERAESEWSPAKAVLAVPDIVPRASALDVEQAAATLAMRGVNFEVWDARKLRELSRGHLDFDPADFDVEKLAGFASRAGASGAAGVVPENLLPIGSKDGVIVLAADFCSFSKFVRASGSDTDLVTSIMGRFYRESRAAIAEHRGILDKYMGDGILCYWLSNEPPALFEACVDRLIGIALNLAEEWQDQIDLAVEPRGLRAGAAVGEVLFIEEQPGTGGPIHAVGDSINIASRLQSEAEPNTLVVANRLRTRCFGGRSDFEELGSRSLKNIGDVIAWRKKFGRHPAADSARQPTPTREP